jgi:hypothetical protein
MCAGSDCADAGRQRAPMRLFKSEALASAFESAGAGADNGFAESSATRIQRGSASAPGLSIVAGLLVAADGECGGETELGDVAEFHFGASGVPSIDVVAEPIHQGWHPVRITSNAMQRIPTDREPCANQHCWTSQQWRQEALCCDGRAKIANPFA